MNYIWEYWNEIQAGRCIVSNRARKQYEKLIDDIDNPKNGIIFDEGRANRPIDFIERFCKHSKGEWAGKPLLLELFQKAYISALFGFIHAEDGRRRYKESFFMVARKNGKTSMLAGIALYMLLADGEPGAEIYSTATKADQARILFEETHNMVKQSPLLRTRIRKRKADLYYSDGMGKIQALGKNSHTLDGLNAYLVIMDELHGVRDRNLYEVMKQSQSARKQPLLIMITTAGTVRECIFDDMYEYACNVIDGVFPDDTFLPIIYELDSRSEWKEPKAWVKANPGLGTIKKPQSIIDEVERAKNNPKDLTGILVKDFNIRETASGAWLSYDDINNTATFDIEHFRGSWAIGGADLSKTTDLTCATLLMMDRATQERFVTQMYWMPEDNIQQRIQEDKIPYDEWVRRGLMRLCRGNSINYEDVTAWFLEMLNDQDITPFWIYYDPYSAKYWVQDMERNGFNMVKCYQGAKTLSLPMQLMGTDLQAKRINYNNNPVLKWCLTNTGALYDRNGNVVPIKATSPKQRIDGMASLLDAYAGLHEHYSEFLESL